VLRKALGDDKANLLIDRILQGSDVTGIESLKWMDPGSVAELLRNEHPQIVAAILVHLEFDQASRGAEALHRAPAQRGDGAHRHARRHPARR
jgi:flagellar motor switch protein FliG